MVHLRAMELHMPYGIAHCYLQLNTGEGFLFQPQPDRPVLNLLTSEGWRAELILVLLVIQGAAKKVAPKVFRCLFSNRLEF